MPPAPSDANTSYGPSRVCNARAIIAPRQRGSADYSRWPKRMRVFFRELRTEDRGQRTDRRTATFGPVSSVLCLLLVQSAADQGVDFGALADDEGHGRDVEADQAFAAAAAPALRVDRGLNHLDDAGDVLPELHLIESHAPLRRPAEHAADRDQVAKIGRAHV